MTMPVVFFGHGNPMNALLRNAWTDGWAMIGREIPKPRAVLCVSAQKACRAPQPETIARQATATST